MVARSKLVQWGDLQSLTWRTITTSDFSDIAPSDFRRLHSSNSGEYSYDHLPATDPRHSSNSGEYSFPATDPRHLTNRHTCRGTFRGCKNDFRWLEVSPI